MDMSLIGLELLGIALVCIILIGSQIFITRILLKNVALLVNQLDNNIAEAVKAVIESKIDDNTPSAPPGLAMILELLKNAPQKAEIPRSEDGKFKIIENLQRSEKENEDTSS